MRAEAVPLDLARISQPPATEFSSLVAAGDVGLGPFCLDAELLKCLLKSIVLLRDYFTLMLQRQAAGFYIPRLQGFGCIVCWLSSGG